MNSYDLSKSLCTICIKKVMDPISSIMVMIPGMVIPQDCDYIEHNMWNILSYNCTSYLEIIASGFISCISWFFKYLRQREILIDMMYFLMPNCS